VVGVWVPHSLSGGQISLGGAAAQGDLHCQGLGLRLVILFLLPPYADDILAGKQQSNLKLLEFRRHNSTHRLRAAVKDDPFAMIPGKGRALG